MATVVQDLVTKFSFVGSLAPQEKFNANLTTSLTRVAAVTAALGAAAVAYSRFISTQLRGLDPMIQLRDQTGLAANEIERLNFMAIRTNSTTDAMQGTLSALSQSIGQAAQEGSAEFARLGIAVRDANGEVRQADDVLFDVQKRFAQMNLSRQEQVNFAQSLGIDPSLIRLLNLTQSEMAELNAEASQQLILTDEQVDAADRYNRSLDSLSFSMRGIRNMVAVGLAPQMEAMAKRFGELLSANRDWIIKGLQRTGELLSAFMDMIIRVAPFIAAVGAAFLAAKIAAMGFGAVMAAIFSPVVVISAIIAGAVLILDDLIVAFQGGQSVIRGFIQEWFGIDIAPILQQMVADVVWAVGEILELFSPLGNAVGDIFSALGNLLRGNFSEALDDIQSAFRNLGEFVMGFFGRIFKDLGNLAMSILPDWAVSLIRGDDDAPQSADEVQQNRAPDTLRRPAISPEVQRQINQTVNMNIMTSDPDRAGRVANDRLQDQLGTADALIFRGGR